MQNTRAPFDPNLPIIAAGTELVCAGKRFAVGALVPWSTLGLSQTDLLVLWQGGRVDCQLVSTTPPPPAPSPASGAEAAAGSKRRARS